jgi:hypothetical protein
MAWGLGSGTSVFYKSNLLIILGLTNILTAAQLVPIS